MKKLAFLLLSVICLSSAAQDAPVYDDLVIELDSIAKGYKPAGKNFAYIKSKKGTGGLTKVSKADSILGLGLPITDIVLVFSEYNQGGMANRETSNRERWENLLSTYPQFFQFETNYKTVLQYSNNQGDTSSFRPAQGFYVYFPGKEAPKAVESKPVETPAKAEEKKAEEKKPEKVKEEKVKEKKEPKEKEVKEEVIVKEEVVVKEEKPKKEKRKKEEEKKEVVVKEEVKEAPVVVEEVVKEVKPRKEGYAKPKKAKDAKACRPPCYDGGDEGLNTFLKDNIVLSKKQKRKSSDLVCVVTLQLNFDGTIKKTMIQGENDEFNKQVDDAIKKMDLWNPAVKGGVTIKSQVKMTLKYDSGSKSIKPFETMITPRPAPKCTECIPDSQLFGE